VIASIVVAASVPGLVIAHAWRRRPPPPRTRRLEMPMRRDGGPAAPRRGRPWTGVAVAVAASAMAAAIWLPLGVVGIAATVLTPRWRRARAMRRRRAAIRRALPDVVDLFVVAVGAGLTPALAIPRLAQFAPAPFDGAFAEVARRHRRGLRLGDALDALVELLGDGVYPVVAALASSERYGTPLGPALELAAHDARRERRRLADEAARTIPVKLCFPLVCCALPAFVLLTVAPLVAGALRSLRL
jgi:tight adherence protein C